MYQSFEELKQAVINDSSSEEKQIVENEAWLFTERGWQNYVLFLCNLIIKLDLEKRFYLDLRKSAIDSFIICKACDLYRMNKLKNSQKSKDILYNDALRLDIEIVGLTDYFRKEIFEVGAIIEQELQNSKFKYYERIEPQNRWDDLSEIILVSQGEVPLNEQEIVYNEVKDSTAEENEVLRKYLILHFTTRNRL